MPISYEDYKPQSSISHTKDGKVVTRKLQIRADDEIKALNDADLPPRGESLDIGTGSISQFLYVDEVDVQQVANAAATGQGEFLFDAVITWKPLTSGDDVTPVVDKATWRVSFQPDQIQILNVDEDGDQTHYGPGSAGENWPEVTTGINEDLQGPKGVTISEMTEKLSIDFWKDPDDVEAYLADVRTIKNTTNDAPFIGPWGTYAIGSAKITGLEVAIQSDEIVTVSLEISVSENATVDVQLDNGPTLVEIVKKGWQYLWVRWIKSSAPDDDDSEQKPRRIDAHLADVYKEGDFDKLGVTPDIFT